MGVNKEGFNQFRIEMDSLLSDLKPNEELKQRVIDRLKQDKRPQYWHKLKISTAISFACFVTIIGLTQIPVVNAQVMPVLSKFTSWVQEVTKIPVRLPIAWQPMQQIDEGVADAQKNNPLKSDLVNYSFFINRTDNSYSMGIYSVMQPIPVSQSVFYEQKSIPFGYRHYSTISGEKITNKMSSLKYENDIPVDAEAFELIDGVTAYKNDEETSIWWEQDNCIFEFTGSNNSLASMKRLAKSWSDLSALKADRGHIRIVEGNMLIFSYTWDYKGIRYNYYARIGDNWDELIKVLNSFTNSEDLVKALPDLSSMIGTMEQLTHIPIQLPTELEAIIEYNKIIPNDKTDTVNDSKIISQDKSQRYYFEVERADDSYNIDVYYSKNQLPINDKDKDSRENGPEFSERKVGSFGAEKISDKKLLPKWVTPKGTDTKPFELIPGVNAYKSINDNTIYWDKENWTFKYTDNSSNAMDLNASLKYLKDIAAMWSNTPFEIKGAGHINITFSTKLQTYITWDQDGVFYHFETYSTDIKEIVDILNSFKENSELYTN